jgi:hypothetical protein
MRRLILAIGFLLIGVATLVAGDLLPYHRRAVVRCWPPQQIPYVRHNPTNPVTKETFTGVLLPVAVDSTAITASLVSDPKIK